MYIEKPKELLRKCSIKPLDDKDGLIVAIRYDICYSMILVRYFDFAGIRHDWFYDFELDLKDDIDKDRAFFRSD